MGFAKWILPLTLFPLLSACGGPIRDFVMSGDSEIPLPVVSTAESSRALKVSPGAVTAMGPRVGARLTVTPTRQRASGSQVKAEISLSRTRVE